MDERSDARPAAGHVRGVCLDLFHTLVDVSEVPARVGGFTADLLGVERDAWNRACFGAHHEIRRPTDGYEAIRRLAHALDPRIPDGRIRAAAAARERRFAHALRHPRAEVLAALDRLRRAGLRLALVSNASTAEVAAWEASPLAGRFDAAVFSCTCGSAKPEPAIYRHAAGAIGVPPQACAFVGDGGSDELRGARRVGMLAVQCRHFTRRRPDLARQRAGADAHHVAEDLEGVVALLLGETPRRARFDRASD